MKWSGRLFIMCKHFISYTIVHISSHSNSIWTTKASRETNYLSKIMVNKITKSKQGGARPESNFILKCILVCGLKFSIQIFKFIYPENLMFKKMFGWKSLVNNFFYPKQLWVLKIIGRRIGPKNYWTKTIFSHEI